MIDFLLFLIPTYIVVAAKYYATYKKAGLLESEQRYEYYCHIIFWPFVKLKNVNPFEKLAELFFKNYGDKGVFYTGWGGLRNLYNDLIKGDDRYKNIKVVVSRFELKEEMKEPFFKGSKFAKVVVAKQNEKYRYFCSLCHEKFKDDSWSIYDLDNSPQVSKDNLIGELKELHLNENEIKDILQKL